MSDGWQAGTIRSGAHRSGSLSRCVIAPYIPRIGKTRGLRVHPAHPGRALASGPSLDAPTQDADGNHQQEGAVASSWHEHRDPHCRQRDHDESRGAESRGPIEAQRHGRVPQLRVTEDIAALREPHGREQDHVGGVEHLRKQDLGEPSRKSRAERHQAHETQVQDIEPDQLGIDDTQVVKQPMVAEPEDAEEKKLMIQALNVGIRSAIA